MKLKWGQPEYLRGREHYGYTDRGAEMSVLLDNHYADDTGDGMLRWEWTYESGTVELNGAVLAKTPDEAKQKAVDDMQKVVWLVFDEAMGIEA